MNQIETFERDPAVVEELNAVANVGGQVDRLIINSPETEIKGADLRKVIKGMLKAIEDKRKKYTVPLEEIKRAIIKKARELSAPIVEMENTVKNKQLEYHAYLGELQVKAEAKRREEEADKQKKLAEAERESEGAETFEDAVKAEEKISAVETAPVTPDIEVKKTVKSVGTSTSFRDVWKHDVTDSSKVPRGFMMVDNAVVRDAIRNGVRDIPGIRIYQETITSVR